MSADKLECRGRGLGFTLGLVLGTGGPTGRPPESLAGPAGSSSVTGVKVASGLSVEVTGSSRGGGSVIVSMSRDFLFSWKNY